MSKVRVNVEGYGRVKVKVPKRLTRETVADAIGDAVAKTMQLVTDRPERLHPALGMGKY